MNVKSERPRNATGSVKARIEKLNVDFSSSGVQFSSHPLPKIEGYDIEGGIQVVSIGASGVTGPGTYDVAHDWSSSVTMSFNLAALPFTDITRSGTIYFEDYEKGIKAKGTYDVTLYSSGHRVQGSFDVVSD